MERRRLGKNGPQVSALGLGCMGMSFAYGPADEAESLRVLRRYLELGGNFLDTAEIYGPYTNEELLGRFLRGVARDSVIIATKFGFRFSPDGVRGLDSSPENVRRACDASLKRLGVETIDLFYQHRVDPKVPIEDTVGAMAELVSAGKVRALGLSEAGPQTLGSSDRSAAKRVFALVPRRRKEWRPGHLPRARDHLCALQPARARLFNRRDPKTRGS